MLELEPPNLVDTGEAELDKLRQVTQRCVCVCVYVCVCVCVCVLLIVHSVQ